MTTAAKNFVDLLAFGLLFGFVYVLVDATQRVCVESNCWLTDNLSIIKSKWLGLAAVSLDYPRYNVRLHLPAGLIHNHYCCT